ncbi:polysaccharide deacetylase family protein [Pseudorhodoferax sp. Leaf274]|uniref:polysaccharide deacetylase family protein n=1 Tax=Pseudorhodoferax sp. Leaf274 TaxID=1736318 RepID=UPI00070336FE|nr:polysaccharide deacetylase family protein [Pseudorhodoferax sp. Leaf274]KQP39787.1 glycosyltransferase [Pseudorhodoferax sp. Leaf274]
MLERARHTPARLPAGHPPVLLVVVDTEEEFDWSRPFDRSSTETSSIAAQPHIHERIFDRYGIVPTYCVDWPVATTPASVATLRQLMEAGRCEIGTHLHPWVCPPHEEEVNTFNSYAGNLPPDLEYRKLENMTRAITKNFGRAPITFKAGRYGVGPQTAASIARLGYRIDASVVPRTAFKADGGPDFTASDEQPFWFPVGDARLLELPVTTAYCGLARAAGPALFPALQGSLARSLRLGGIAARTGLLERIRLTPEGCDPADLVRLMDTLHGAGCQVFSLTYHSPSLAVGHTPYVRDAAALERFLTTVEQVCRHFAERLGGTFMSLSALHERLSARP